MDLKCVLWFQPPLPDIYTFDRQLAWIRLRRFLVVSASFGRPCFGHFVFRISVGFLEACPLVSCTLDYERLFEGRKDNGTRPSHFCRASTSIIRKALKGLEELKMAEVDSESGYAVVCF